MSEPFDVSLRLRLDYQGQGAKAATADLQTVKAAADRLGAPGNGSLTRELQALAAAQSKIVATMEAATRRFDSGPATTRTVADLERVSRAATVAGQRLEALRTAGGGDIGRVMAEFQQKIGEGAQQAARAIGEVERASERLASTSGPRAVQRELGAVREAADAADAALQKVNRQASVLGTSGSAAAHFGQVWPAGAPASTSPGRSNGSWPAGVGTWAAGAAVTGGGGRGRGTSPQPGAGRGGGGALPPGGGGHGGTFGPGGYGRNFERGALMPFRMERMGALALSAGGLAGMGVGFGLYEAGRGLAHVEEQAIDFETAMVGVKRALGDLPDSAVQKLGNSILAVSRNTGTGRAELAGLAAEAARAGRPLDQIPGFLERSAKAAQVMGIGVDQAGEKLIELGRTWHQNGAALEDTTDAIALAAQKTGARPAGVLDFVNRFSSMRGRGMSAVQAAGLGAGLQASGLDPSQATSAFGGLTERLAAPQRAGQEFQQRAWILAHNNPDLALGPDQLRAGMRTDPTRTTLNFLEAIKRLPENGRGNVLAGMFGPEQGEMIGRIAEHLDDVRRALAAVEDTGQRSGALQRAFSIFDDTTRAKLDKMEQAFGRLQVNLGKLFTPAVSASADAMSRVFDAASRFLERSEANQKAVEEADKHAQPVPPVEPPRPSSKTQPEMTVPDIADHRAAVRQDLERQLRDLQHQKEVGAGGPFIDKQIEAARRRLAPFDQPVSPPPVPPSSHGLRRPIAFRTDDEGKGSSGPLASIIEAGTKAGVIEGMRAVLDLRSGRDAGGGGGIIRASYDPDGGSPFGRGGTGGGEMGSDADETPIGRAFAAPRGPRGGRAGAPNVRYGRGGHTPGASAPSPRHRAGQRSGAPSTTFDTTLTPEARGLLDTIAGTESPGYDVRYGGAHFSGFADHPRIRELIRRGPNAGKTSDAAGRYQFLSRTWDGLKGRYGLKDFSPGEQDKGAWALAQEDYQKRTKRDLAADLKAHEYRYLGKGLHGTWTSLPGGIEQGTNAESFRKRMEASVERERARVGAPAVATVSPRFGPQQPSRSGTPDASIGGDHGASPSRSGLARMPPMVQNFYGMHDPRETARHAQLEGNRNVRRAQAGALHSVGRVA